MNFNDFSLNILQGVGWALGAAFTYAILYFFFGSKGKGIRKLKIRFK